MQIHHLELHATHLNEQFDFYTQTLGFNCKHLTADSFELHTRENTILFKKQKPSTYYHFAFLIPTGTLSSAIEYVEARKIRLLPYQDSKIIQFSNGQSIYFYDRDDNIVEFIERPLLDYPSGDRFSIDQVIKVNEIGLPVADPLRMAHKLTDKYGIQPRNNPPFREDFCWVGDHSGVIIVTKLGRHWLPTDRPGVINDLTIHFSGAGGTYRLQFEQNAITELEAS